MEFKLDIIRADKIVDDLAGTGEEGRARKAIRNYRTVQTEDSRKAALAAISLLDENKQTELRQRAG
jgi:hypothetical protein